MEGSLTLPMYHSFRQEDSICMVFPKCPYDFFAYYEMLRAKNVSQEEFAKSLSKDVLQLCKMMILLHQNGITHMDIKGENIVKFHEKLAFIDFGQSAIRVKKNVIAHVNIGQQCNDAYYLFADNPVRYFDKHPFGTIAYQHPNVALFQPVNLYSHDWWSLAIMVLTYYIGHKLFGDKVDKGSIRWQREIQCGNWSKILACKEYIAKCPDLKDISKGASWPSFVKFIDFLCGFSGSCDEEQWHHELLQQEFLHIWES